MSALDYCETVILPKQGHEAAVTLWRDSCLSGFDGRETGCSAYYVNAGTITSTRPPATFSQGEITTWRVLARLAAGEHLSPHDVDAAADGVDAENALAIRAACEQVNV